MAYNQNLPEWHAEGTEPSETQKNTGFQPGMKPPAQWFNWFLNWTYLALKELQEKAAEQSTVDASLETIRGDIDQLQEEIGDADIPDATLTTKGKVQLSNATNGASQSLVPTEYALGLVMTEANAAKQLGVEQKANVVAALNSIGVSASTSETWEQLIAKMATVIRATGNATAAQVLAGATFSNATANGLTGTMVNRGAVSQSITTQNGSYTIPAGYHNGLGVIQAVFANLIASNIRSGVNVGGITGTLTEGPKYATGTVVSTTVTTERSFRYALSESSLDNYQASYYVLVTGIGFRPKRIIITQYNNGVPRMNAYTVSIRNAVPGSIEDGNYNFYSSLAPASSVNRAYMVAELTGSLVYPVTGVNTQAYVNDNSFLLPVSGNGVSHTWEAWGE